MFLLDDKAKQQLLQLLNCSLINARIMAQINPLKLLSVLYVWLFLDPFFFFKEFEYFLSTRQESPFKVYYGAKTDFFSQVSFA